MTRNVAILGAGIGEKHLIAYARLTDRFTVTDICDLNTDRAQRLASRVGARASSDLDAVLNDPVVDIIDICLPPPLHVPVTLKALALGKHVILEKPIAGSLKEADMLREAEAKSSGRIFPVFQYRYGRAFESMERLRQAGFLSRPLVASLETHWNRGKDYYGIPWRGTWEHELGGVVLSHAIHAHDLLTTAFGPIAQVSSFLATLVNPIETEDCAAISLRMKNGATATSSITLGAAGNTSRLRFIYDGMTIESDNSDKYPYTPGEADWNFQARDPLRQAEVNDIIASIKHGGEGFEGFCTAIADALDGRPSNEVTLDDGIAAIELATAIYHSDRIGSQISLPMDRSLSICNGLTP